MAAISHLVRIRANAEDVYARVATTAGIAEWFTKASSSNYAAGGSLELHFSDESTAFTVAELVPSSRIRWRCTSEKNSWYETDIIFEFEQRDDVTIVRFDHLGWSEVSDLFRDCSMSWAYFLESLRMLIEDGQGTPEGFDPCPRQPQ